MQKNEYRKIDHSGTLRLAKFALKIGKTILIRTTPVFFLWRVFAVKIKRANFLQYEYLNSSFISHYFLILFFSKPLLSYCISLPQVNCE